MYESMGKVLIAMGVMLVVVGTVLMFLPKFSFGNLPLDLHFRWGNADVYLPIGTSLLVSILLTLLLNLVLWVIAWLTRG